MDSPVFVNQDGKQLQARYPDDPDVVEAVARLSKRYKQVGGRAGRREGLCGGLQCGVRGFIGKGLAALRGKRVMVMICVGKFKQLV